MIAQVNSEAEYGAGAGSIMGCPMREVKNKLQKNLTDFKMYLAGFYFGFPVKPYSRLKGVS